MTENTETIAWNPVRSKMKLFAKVIDCMRAVTHKVPKENASFLNWNYCYLSPSVLPLP